LLGSIAPGFGTKEIVMPKQKDLKRIVRSRMEKTGESYTAARLQVVKKKARPEPDYALAGMSDAALKKQTGRGWAEWVAILDEWGAAQKPHRDIAEHVYSLGVPGWWSQTVTVGYERIRGLREKGQRRTSGLFEASKSRTFKVPVKKLFAAFANARTRRRWLPVKLKVRTATEPKTMRITWEDDTLVQLYFMPKGTARSVVTVQHEKLPSKAAAVKMKGFWEERLSELEDLL
jgi:uncharacterized protein YndB with AHSA1/START domain